MKWYNVFVIFYLIVGLIFIFVGGASLGYYSNYIINKNESTQNLQELVNGPPAILLLPPTMTAQMFEPQVVPWVPGTVPVFISEEQWNNGEYKGVTIIANEEGKSIWPPGQPSFLDSYSHPNALFQYNWKYGYFVRKLDVEVKKDANK